MMVGRYRAVGRYRGSRCRCRPGSGVCLLCQSPGRRCPALAAWHCCNGCNIRFATVHHEYERCAASTVPACLLLRCKKLPNHGNTTVCRRCCPHLDNTRIADALVETLCLVTPDCDHHAGALGRSHRNARPRMATRDWVAVLGFRLWLTRMEGGARSRA